MENMVMAAINEMVSAKFVNLTPHAVNIVTASGGRLDLAPTGNMIRYNIFRKLNKDMNLVIC